MTSHHQSPQSPKGRAQALMLSVSALMSLWARKATQVSGKMKKSHDGDAGSPSSAQKKMRPLSGKRLLSNISNKAMSLVMHNTRGRKVDEAEEGEEDQYKFDFGDGGVWQKAILMGDKCQPLDFSGAIYYDESGKKLDHVPLRSPRASPLPGYLARRMEGEVRA